MRFFFDNQLPPSLARAINELIKSAGDLAIPLRDKFAANTPDAEWIGELANEGSWAVVCGDLQIIKSRAQIPIWKKAQLIGFFLQPGWINLQQYEQASKLIKIWPRIRAQAEIAAPGSTYSVPVKSQKIETFY